jgi:hypothetical protein
VVLEFFVSKLPLYYSSSQLTLLLTGLAIPSDLLLNSHDILENIAFPELPSKLKTMDLHALALHRIFTYVPAGNCNIFQDFLGSGHPQALDSQRYATATLACLKLVFKHYQPPVSYVSWLSQHSHTLRSHIEHYSQWNHITDKTSWTKRINFYWHLRTSFSSRMPPKHNIYIEDIVDTRPDEFHADFLEKIQNDSSHSAHLQSLLEKSAHSDDILHFAHHRVFRFGYLHREHPKYMKKAIFALAKYIHRVTGETAEVKACESIWGCDR